MRPVLFAAAVASITVLATAAEAQPMPRGPMSSPAPAARGGGHWQAPRPMPGSPVRPRWGGRVDGRWYAGVYAPGGWSAYRRPVRGWALPAYWFAPTFYINDYASYGLGAPPSGYSWTRYYDDAVLVDHGGRVYDSVSGIDWDRYDDGGYYEDDGGYAPEPMDGPGYAPPPPGAGYAPPPPPPIYDRERRSNGVGGALIGGGVGAVAGNLIAGRGNRLAGTLIGGAVGAVAGAVIDESSSRGRRVKMKKRKYPEPVYGGGYPAPYPAYGYPAGGYAPPPVVYAPPAEVVQQSYASGYDSAAYGYGTGAYTNVYYGPGTTTTVTVIPGQTTTTETEYVYEEAVRSVAARRTYAKKRAYRPRPKARICSCVCRVVCK